MLTHDDIAHLTAPERLVLIGELFWGGSLTEEETPLIYVHINPYGVFELDMSTRQPIDEMRMAA